MTRDWILSSAAVLLVAGLGATFTFGGEVATSPNGAAAATTPVVPSPSSARILLGPDQARQAIAAGELDREITSILNVGKGMRHGDFIWNDAGVPDGPTWIRVDLKRQLISIFRSGHEIGTAVILYGATEKATPSGDFRVLWKREDHHSATYDAPMPYTLRLTDDGIAIHGSDILSGRATHGCIGVPIEFARHLFEGTAIGDEVTIVA